MKFTGSAIFSDCGLYRYKLTRQWGMGGHVAFIMLNPSTADADTNDPTVAKCCRYAQQWGYGGLEVLNLFAFRATDPRMLCKVADPNGPENNQVMLTRILDPTITRVVAAWGCKEAQLYGRGDAVAKMVRAERDLFCLEMSKDGFPKHPLYLKGNLVPIPYTGRISAQLRRRMGSVR